MSSTILFLTHDQQLNARGRKGKDLLRAVINKAHGCLSGVERNVNYTVISSTTAGGNGSGLYLNSACAAGILASASGTVGITINGETNNVSQAVSDTHTADLIADAINANTNGLVADLVGATNLKSSLTLASVLAGTVIEIAGFRFTAIDGTTESYKMGEFKIGGTDTADGTSLVLAINRHPYANRYLFALNVAGVVHVFPKSVAWFTGPNAPANIVKASASTVTVGSATFAASAYVGIWCRWPGRLGNSITVAAVGTNVSIANTATRLTLGISEGTPITQTL